MKRLARTRSLTFDSQPGAGFAQCSVGSIDEDGMRYGLTIHCFSASTIRTAPAIVSTQSRTTRAPRGRPGKRRPSGSRPRLGAGWARVVDGTNGSNGYVHPPYEPYGSLFVTGSGGGALRS